MWMLRYIDVLLIQHIAVVMHFMKQTKCCIHQGVFYNGVRVVFVTGLL